MQTVVCMKWGDRYPSLFVNRLWSMIRRHTTRETRLICYTDDSTGIDSDVLVRPLPDILIPSYAESLWRKVSLWRSDLPDLSGDILFFDLDMVITGSIDSFFDYERGKFCVIHDWHRPYRLVGNTSVFRFPFGEYGNIYDNYIKDPDIIVRSHGNEQEYVTSMIPDKIFWPSHWCVHFRHTLLPKWPLNFIFPASLPSDALCVAFSTLPDQDDAAQGIWPENRWWKRIYKYTRPTPWITEHWR